MTDPNPNPFLDPPTEEVQKRKYVKRKNPIDNSVRLKNMDYDVPEIAFLTVMQVIHHHYLTHRQFPSLGAVAKRLPDYNPIMLRLIMASPEMCTRLNDKDVPYARDMKALESLTAEMLYCARVVLDTTRTDDLGKRLKSIGVPFPKYKTWMRNRYFAEIISIGAAHMLDDHYVDMQRALVQQAVKGDVNAIKFAYELNGKYDPNNKQIMEIDAVIASVVEIIQKHVTNPDDLRRIATEMQFLAAKATGTATPVAGIIEGTVIDGINDENSSV